MVKFRKLKLKHYRRALELNKAIGEGEANDLDVVEWAVTLVAEWDFKDEETGEDIPLGEVDELDEDQFEEVLEGLRARLNKGSTVPKENA